MGCRKVFRWIISLLLWASIAFIAVSFALDLSTSAKPTSIYLTAIIAIIYYCETFICSYCSYFMNLSMSAKSYEEMDRMFKAAPTLTMRITCYHYGSSRRSKGGSTGSKRVVTYHGREMFSYQSWRDISGEFKLDTSAAAKDDDYAYVMLSVSLETHFANDGTEADYARAKQRFISRSRFDRYQTFSQITEIRDFRNKFLVQVTDSPPCCFGLGYFLFFGLLTLNVFYSAYVESHCQMQHFIIKKAISTRQNLNVPELQSQYAYYDPRMTLPRQVVVFAPNQAPQVVMMNQPVAQQYASATMTPPETLFVPMTQGIEELEASEYGSQSNLSQATMFPGENSMSLQYAPQYAIPPQMMMQGQYAQFQPMPMVPQMMPPQTIGQP